MNLNDVEDLFKKAVGSTFTCAICGNLLMNAHQSSCGCFRSCGSCDFDHRCRFCGDDITLICDKAFSKSFKQLHVPCVFDQCDAKLVYDQFLAHLAVCNFRMIACTNCLLFVQLPQLNEHRIATCEYNLSKCLRCDEMVRFSKSKHVFFDEKTAPDCAKLFGNCPNCQQMDVELRTHYTVCTNRPCLLRELGCSGHMQSKKCSNFDKHIGIIKNRLRDFRDSVGMFDTSDTEVLKDISKDKIAYLRQQVSDIQQILEKNFELYRTPKKGKLIWRITDVSSLLNRTGSVLSDPMYSHEYGYKLCLKIYPQGDGVHSLDCLSVYFVIMRGPYDELLQWPFNKKVKVTIYNQWDLSKSKSEIYKTKFGSECSNKPCTTMNIATGNPAFISRFELRNNGFVVENIMFIELSVMKDISYL